MKAKPAARPTVFVVDDDRPMRESLVALCGAMGFATRGFDSADAFLAYYQPAFPGCLVLDIQMPGQTGLELQQRLIREGKRLPVIFITAHADVATAVAAMKTGAVEFLEKPFERHTLRARIESALALDARWRERAREFGALDQRFALLTERERATLALILAGASNKRMAGELHISERAVEMRRAALMRKLKVRTLAELIELAITHRTLAERSPRERAEGR